MKRLTAFLLCILMLLSLCACTEEEPEPTEPAETYAPVSFENHGRTVTVGRAPRKAVTAGPHCTEIFCALGLADLVVGKCMSNHSQGALEELADDYYTIPDLAVGYPDYEDIISSGCDFLLATDWIFGEDLTIKSLEKAGITVFVLSTDSIGSLCADLRTVAKIFEVSGRAEEIIALQAPVISQIIEKLPEQEPLRVLVLDSFVGEKVYVTGSYGYENELISAAGGVNIFAGLEKKWDAVTPEEIMEARPDFIIIHDYEGSSADEKHAALNEHALLGQLPCVWEGRVLHLPLENSFPGVRCAMTVELLAAEFFPDMFE